jgi:hypothetical protein
LNCCSTAKPRDSRLDALHAAFEYEDENEFEDETSSRNSSIYQGGRAMRISLHAFQSNACMLGARDAFASQSFPTLAKLVFGTAEFAGIAAGFRYTWIARKLLGTVIKASLASLKNDDNHWTLWKPPERIL